MSLSQSIIVNDIETPILTGLSAIIRQPVCLEIFNCSFWADKISCGSEL